MKKKLIVLIMVMLLAILLFFQWRHYLESTQIEIVTFDFEDLKGLNILDGDKKIQVDDSMAYELYALLNEYTMSPRFVKMPKENRLSDFQYSILFWVDNDLWYILLSDDMNVIYINEDWYVITDGLEFKDKVINILE